MRLADIVLDPDIESRLRRGLREHRGQQKLEAYGSSPRRKLLLIGPPGALGIRGERGLYLELSSASDAELALKSLDRRDRSEAQRHIELVAVREAGDTTFATLFVPVLVISPTSARPSRVKDLLREYPGVPKESMGFPADWETSPLWRTSSP